MKALARLTLFQQLMLVFGICVVTLIGIGAMAISRLQELSVMQETMYQAEVVPLGLTGTASWQAATHFRRAYPYILKTDEKSRAETVSLNQNAEADIVKAIDFERAHPGDSHQQALLADFDTIWPQYKDSVARMQAAARSGNNDAAFEELNHTTDPLHVRLRKLMISLGELRAASARDRAQAGVELVQHEARLLTALVAVSVLLAGGAGWWMSRRITRQIGGEPQAASEIMARVAAGDLSTDIRLVRGDADSLMARLAAMQGDLVRVIDGVRQGAESVATASQQIAQGNLDLSQRTETQASALEQTAAAMEELGSTVQHNTDSARTADGLARQASEVAERGGVMVRQVVQTMGNISESSKKIADIIGVIDGIAFQTNILALNAAVESARAGEHGRGFAVVAGEVRSLAQRSAEAAKEIKGLIGTSVQHVAQGMQVVETTGSTMGDMQAAVRRVAEVMSDITTASQEQGEGVRQVGEAIQQMDQGTQQNAALVEETAAAAESLRTQSQQLVDAVALFKLR